MINRKYFALSLSAIFLLVMVLLFQWTCNQSEVPAPVITAPKEIIKEVEVMSKDAVKTIDSLEAVNNDLHNKIFVEHINYTGLKRSAAITQAALRQQISDLDSGAKADAVRSTAEDYFAIEDGKAASCDSLLALKDEAISNRDSMLSLKDSLYTVLLAGFDKSIDNNIKMIDYTGKLNKQLKRKKAGNMLWKGLAVAAGLVVLNNVTK